MPAFRDLTGQVFGRLTVQSYDGKRQWVCLCECGNQITIRGDHLVRHETLSCGCLRTAEDLTHHVFGEWTVLHRQESNAYGSPLWVCRCTCGTVREHQSSNLLSGSTTSCGCLERGRTYVGEKFGRLTVLIKLKTHHSQPTMLICLCECGNHTRVHAVNVTSGRTQSCGCLQHEHPGGYTTTHGMSRSRVYGIWAGMIQRCHNPKAANYDRYGGRGIEVCWAWRTSFESFYQDMGDPHTDVHTLDRYPNPSGPYEKANCRWATPLQQGRNKDDNHMVTYNNQTFCVSEWAEIIGISRSGLSNRLQRWSVEKALSTPVHPRKHPITLDGETHCLIEWLDLKHLSAATYHARRQDGWSVHDALTLPPDRHANRNHANATKKPASQGSANTHQVVTTNVHQLAFIW